MTMPFYLFRFTWMISSLVALLMCFVKILGNDGVTNVQDRRTNLFLRYLSQANEAMYLCTASQVHEGPGEEVQHG
jgi:hypothetical protein